MVYLMIEEWCRLGCTMVYLCVQWLAYIETQCHFYSVLASLLEAPLGFAFVYFLHHDTCSHFDYVVSPSFNIRMPLDVLPRKKMFYVCSDVKISRPQHAAESQFGVSYGRWHIYITGLCVTVHLKLFKYTICLCPFFVMQCCSSVLSFFGCFFVIFISMTNYLYSRVAVAASESPQSRCYFQITFLSSYLINLTEGIIMWLLWNV